MKRGKHLLESIFDPKTQLKTIVPLCMEVWYYKQDYSHAWCWLKGTISTPWHAKG